MTLPREAFVAEILESAPRAHAAAAAALLSERDPAADRRGPGAWRDTLEGVVRELAGALVIAAPERFAASVAWLGAALGARGFPAAELERALAALEESLAQSLPHASAVVLLPYWRAARAGAGALDPAFAGEGSSERVDEERVKAFLSCIVAGDPSGAVSGLLRACDAEGATIRTTLTEVLLPATAEVGRLWIAGELSVAEEHLASRVTRRAIGALLARDPSPPPPGAPSVLLACVEHDAHDLGLALLGALFELDGWRPIEVGADLPARELAAAVRAMGPDLVVISASLGQQLGDLARSIAAVRAAGSVPILVGGNALAGSREHALRLGADGYAPTLSEAPEIARRLLRT